MTHYNQTPFASSVLDLTLATRPPSHLPVIMGSEVTAKATALSFFSFPPEVRVQIYGNLLVHSSSIQPQFLRSPRFYTGIERAQRALSNSRPQVARDFSPESAILRTCRQICLEAMPVLYEKNTFSYSCDMSIFNDEDYLKLGFPDQNLQRIKRLELRVQPRHSVEPMVHTSFAATIQYFVDRDCDIQTFNVEIESDHRDDYDDEEEKQRFLSAVALSSDVLAALVRLKVLKTLTISLSCYQKRTMAEHKLIGTKSDVFNNNLIKSLAPQKNFTVTIEECFDTTFLGYEYCEGCYDGSCAGLGNWYDLHDTDCYVTFYSPSWCLRPQHSNAQTANASA